MKWLERQPGPIAALIIIAILMLAMGLGDVIAEGVA